MLNRLNTMTPLVMILALYAVSAHAAEDGLSGTWATDGPVAYLVEHTPEHPQGKPVPHQGVQIVERSASLEWTLMQRPDGLITGTNDWIAFDENGKQVFEGIEPLLGAFDGRRGVLTEPSDDSVGTARIVFEISSEGRDRIRAIGYSVTGPKMLAMHFVLTRKR